MIMKTATVIAVGAMGWGVKGVKVRATYSDLTQCEITVSQEEFQSKRSADKLLKLLDSECTDEKRQKTQKSNGSDPSRDGTPS